MGPRLDGEIQRARAGDPRAFRKITEAIGPGLTRFVTIYLRGDLHAAHDVVQETMLAAWRHLEHLDTADHLKAWVYRVARCKAVSWLRRRSPPGTKTRHMEMAREPESGFPVAPSRRRAPRPPPPDPSEAPLDLGARLREAMDRLPRHYAAAVQLHYLHGLTARDTAGLLGLELNAVKMRLHRARRYLRRYLEREADGALAPWRGSEPT